MSIPDHFQDSTLATHLAEKYPGYTKIFPDNSIYQTKLPIESLLIQFLASGILLTLGSYLNSGPITCVGGIMAVASVWNNAGPDPLSLTFYKIMGGYVNFKKLPKISFLDDEPLVEQILKLDLDKLKSPVYRAENAKRIIVIVKSNFAAGNSDNVRRVFAFVEKLGANDFKPTRTNVPSFFSKFIDALTHAFYLRERDCGYGSIHEKTFGKREVYIRTHITSEMANEFAAQAKSLI
jgi:hypothetical protein